MFVPSIFHLQGDEDTGADYEGEGGEEIVESGQAPAHIPAEANKIRVTTPYMTKYERARILGTRALQIRYVFRLSDLQDFRSLLRALARAVLIECLLSPSAPSSFDLFNQYERTSFSTTRWRIRSFSHRHEGIDSSQDSINRETILTRWIL